MAKPEVSKETQQLFLKLLNFTPDLLAKTQHEAKLHNTSFDALVRAAVEKYVNALTVAREQREAKLASTRVCCCTPTSKRIGTSS